MKSELELYKEEKLKDPDFMAKYILAKEKLNIELMLDSLDDALDKKSSYQTIKRRISKLRKHISAISL